MLYRIRKGAARVILCSALVISTIPMPVQASSGDSGRMLEAQFEDAEGFRLFKYRTLRALNELRDMGLTPQAIVETIQGVRENGVPTDSADESSFDEVVEKDDNTSPASDIAQDIAGAVQERTQSVTDRVTSSVTNAGQKVAEDVTDAAKDASDKVVQDATDAAKTQMNNWIDGIGESIGKAVRDAIDGALGKDATE